MTLTVTDDWGNDFVVENVLDYNYIDVDLVQDLAENHWERLTAEQLKEVARRCKNKERLPDIDDLEWLIQDVMEGK